jgi:alkyl sulfatase BDS1-like metallo-beta-lactamase superfamily hydrolase
VKIVIYTHSFAPQIGGVETIVFSLAQVSREYLQVARPPPRGLS